MELKRIYFKVTLIDLHLKVRNCKKDVALYKKMKLKQFEIIIE